MRQQIDNIYRPSQYGYGAIGTEVGGFFRAKSSKTQFVRYAQFGCMTACMINGGENGAFSAHLPWHHGKDVEDIYRRCVVWMKQLAPYKFSTVVEAHQKGGSLMQSTSIEENSHRLGYDIFTAAITTDDGRADFHLPNEGEWLDFWTGECCSAGQRITATYPLHQFPLFIRSGAIIPMQITDDVTGIGDASMKGKRVFVIYPNGHTSRRFHLPVAGGVDYFDCQVTYDDRTRRLTLQSDRDDNFLFLIKGKKTIRVEAKGRNITLRRP